VPREPPGHSFSYYREILTSQEKKEALPFCIQGDVMVKEIAIWDLPS
jgi:hypothetical protein